MTKGRYREGYYFVWNGGHTVNVWTAPEHAGGRNIDVFSVGDFAKDKATPHEVERGIQNWLKLHEDWRSEEEKA